MFNTLILINGIAAFIAYYLTYFLNNFVFYLSICEKIILIFKKVIDKNLTLSVEKNALWWQGGMDFNLPSMLI